jgi:hypothetical protein
MAGPGPGNTIQRAGPCAVTLGGNASPSGAVIPGRAPAMAALLHAAPGSSGAVRTDPPAWPESADQAAHATGTPGRLAAPGWWLGPARCAARCCRRGRRPTARSPCRPSSSRCTSSGEFWDYLLPAGVPHPGGKAAQGVRAAPLGPCQSQHRFRDHRVIPGLLGRDAPGGVQRL